MRFNTSFETARRGEKDVIRTVVIRTCLAAWVACACPSGLLAAPNPLGPSDVLILVNGSSPVSRSVADLYRRYYPAIAANQVVTLSGLPDSASLTATPANEIITRTQFETLIAAPVRNHLISNNLVNSIYCLITTAGMPYRIEDSNQTSYANAVTPAGSDANLVLTNRVNIDAASVESELAFLFQIDPALTPGSAGPGVPLKNRVVNPYQGYRSPIKSWGGIRDILTRRTQFRWDLRNLWKISGHAYIEGGYDSCSCSANGRIMSPADIYLVARLDGPHVSNVYPIFAVKQMLDRAAAVSNPTPPHTRFVGYSPSTSALVIDSTPPPAASELSQTTSYNYPGGTTFLSFETNPVPPGKESYTGCSNCPRGTANHYDVLFSWLTGLPPTAGAAGSQPMIIPFGGTAVWDDTTSIMNSSDPFFPSGTGLIGLTTYGRNGNDGRPATYLMTGGPGGGPLFPCAPGAVFTSIESFNAVTMFTETPTSQAKIAEFIQMGGTAAIGHALEPCQDAIVQVEYLYANLLRDDDGDGVGDLSLVEAAFTAIPYLSWTEVVIGDPLMRLRTGPGGPVSLLNTCPTDINGDGFTGYADRLRVLYSYNTLLGDPKYNPAADVNQDGFVGYYDHLLVLGSYGSPCP